MVAGLDSTHLTMAVEARKQGNLAEANDFVVSALKYDPKNERLVTLKIEIDNDIARQVGHVPDAETIQSIPKVEKLHVDVATLVQDGKLFL